MANNSFNGFKIGGLIVIVIALIFVVASSSKLIERLDGDKILLTVDPIDGDYHWHTTAGMKAQRLGQTYDWHKSSQAWFSSKEDQGGTHNQALRIRFNDKGGASLSLSFRWYMPLDEKHLTMCYNDYQTEEGLSFDLIRTVAEKCVYNAGPLMSSMESTSEKRPDLLRYIEDMMINGVYQTVTVDKKTIDPISGNEVTVSEVKIVEDSTAPGNYKRQEVSALTKYGIRVENVAINGIEYDPEVAGQIEDQRRAIINVQTAKADAKAAEQRALTAVKEGEADAAKAKWEQEVIKAKAVTKAEQEKAVAELQAKKLLRVAELDAQAAGQEKTANKLRGDGEAYRKRVVMEADGALEAKIEAAKYIHQNYALALQNYNGDWVPQTVIGGSGDGEYANGGMDLINMLLVKTAKDLSLDLDTNVGSP
jgi:hypothetical protein